MILDHIFVDLFNIYGQVDQDQGHPQGQGRLLRPRQQGEFSIYTSAVDLCFNF